MVYVIIEFADGSNQSELMCEEDVSTFSNFCYVPAQLNENLRKAAELMKDLWAEVKLLTNLIDRGEDLRFELTWAAHEMRECEKEIYG